MRYIYIITISLILASCGPSSEEKKNIASVTCSIMGETRNMDAAVRVREMNNAREKIGGEPFLQGDSVIQEAFAYGLCEELVLGTYDEALQPLKEIERIRDAKPRVVEIFYSNGKLQHRTNYQSKNDGGNMHGLEESYYENGQLDSRRSYKDGKEDGLFESYYENGQLRHKFNYKDGERHGLDEWYYENGQLESKGNWKDGKRDGLWETYYDNGQLKSKYNYKDGEQHGLDEWYYENGQLDSRRSYKDGKEDGLSERYRENGKLWYTTCWKNGERTDDSYCKPQ